MSTPSPEWHADAKKLHAQGMVLSEICRTLGRTRSSVSWALDLGNARLRHRERVRAARQVLVGTRTRDPVRRSPAPPPCRVESEVVSARKPTLPKISLLQGDEPVLPRLLRFAPRTRLTGSPGAERIREIHRRMIREGRIAERGLPDQLHH